MHVANRELCKELYELCGWGERVEGLGAYENKTGVLYRSRDVIEDDYGFLRAPYTPAYDLGYLLRRLPRNIKSNATFLGKSLGRSEDFRLRVEPYRASGRDDEWVGFYTPMGQCSSFGWSIAETPEDVACKLAIELFKQGILKRVEP